jgi:hypothetical protein
VATFGAANRARAIVQPILVCGEPHPQGNRLNVRRSVG